MRSWNRNYFKASDNYYSEVTIQQSCFRFVNAGLLALGVKHRLVQLSYNAPTVPYNNTHLFGLKITPYNFLVRLWVE